MQTAAVAYATLSVHGFIDKVGNYAGFAAIIAVALLIIMVFVNARESAGLRDRAEEAEERLYRLEHHAEQMTRSLAAAQAQAAQAAQAQAQSQTARIAGRPAAAAAATGTAATRAVPPPAAARAAATRPRVAPAGTGGPALASATRLIPLAADPTAEPATNGASSPAPSTAAAGASTPAPAPTPAPVLQPLPSAADSAAAPPRAAPRPTSGAIPPEDRAPRRNYGRAAERSGSRIGAGSLVAALVLVAVVAVALVLVLTHHGSSSSPKRTAQHTRSTNAAGVSKRDKKGDVVVDPRKVTVAVLNGTSTNNLAADISAKLNSKGFQQGATTNYAVATETSTTVGFLPGYRPQATAVAKALHLSQSHVAAVNTDARDIACAATPSNCPDQVVVTVGSDLDSDAS